MALSEIKDIVEDIRQGKMVIIMDDEDRENEGDLIMAAEWARPEDINFMAQYGRGLICLTLTRERCAQLQLPLMVLDTNDKQGTNFTLSIEAAEGVSTGISAADRAMTVRKAVAPGAKPSDIVQPGHIFPIMAQPGGVLSRAGHTEAGCDLARIAGLEPASVIVEILNADGSMARRPDLEKFAAKHQLKMGTIADLIEYRVRNEKTIECVADCELETEFGIFKLHAFSDNQKDELHYALSKGELSRDQPVLVRVHMQDDLSDAFSGVGEGLPLPIRKAMQAISNEGCGVIVLLRRPESIKDSILRIRAMKLKQKVETVSSETVGDLRTYGVGAQILSELGVEKLRIIGAPRKLSAISGFGLNVVEYVSID